MKITHSVSCGVLTGWSLSLSEERLQVYALDSISFQLIATK